MKKHKLFAFIILGGLLVNCNGSKNNNSSSFSFNQKEIKPQYTANDVLKLQIDNVENKKIDSIAYFLNDKNPFFYPCSNFFIFKPFYKKFNKNCRRENQFNFIGVKCQIY